MLYITLDAQSTTTLSGEPGVTFTLPPSVQAAGQNYYIAAFVNGAWETLAGPGSVADQSVTFPIVPGSLTLTQNEPVVFGLYSGAPLGTVSPISASPESLSFLMVGSNEAQTLTATESGYTGAFTIDASNCAGIVSASVASPGQFTVAPIASGACTLKVSDSQGNSTQVIAGVTVTNVGGQ